MINKDKAELDLINKMMDEWYNKPNEDDKLKDKINKMLDDLEQRVIDKLNNNKNKR